MTTQSRVWPTANQEEVEQVEAVMSQRKFDEGTQRGACGVWCGSGDWEQGKIGGMCRYVAWMLW
jgi:hypothetical protein